MNRSEIRATLALSLIYALRMLGMFMVLPVLALYARDLPQGATPMLIGLAIGIYGLVQASLQIPFGALSDRWGRKPVIVIGLLLFAAGSLICALADQIEWVIVGRAVQGAGAISAAASALLADSTRAEVRTQAMAVLGIGVGASFLLALILGPLLAGVIGVDGIFALTGLLALAAIAGLLWLVPTPDQVIASDARSHADIAKVLAVPALLRLDFGIFALHAAMAALFVVVPFS
ncbi:MAG: MFS transporter, partial [Panacagrimonas sp.]